MFGLPDKLGAAMSAMPDYIQDLNKPKLQAPQGQGFFGRFKGFNPLRFEGAGDLGPGGAIYALGAALSGAGTGDPALTAQLMAGRRAEVARGRERAEEKARQAQAQRQREEQISQLKNHLPPHMQGLASIVPEKVASGLVDQAFAQPAERRIIEGPDGIDYYEDTKQPVLPGVQPPPPTPNYKTVTTDEGIFQYDPMDPHGSMQLLGRSPTKSPLVQVNTGDTAAGQRPIVSDPPKDYQLEWDDTAKTYRQIPIPGSQAARDQEMLSSKAYQALQANNEQFGAIIDNIDAADELIGPFTAGVGSYLDVIRGTPARNLAARLETVKANIGFDKLNEMRATSPTGGALGQVTERELKFLQSVRGSLDEGQSPAQLAETLQEVKASLQRLQEVRQIAFQIEQADVAPGEARQRIVSESGVTTPDLQSGFRVTPPENAIRALRSNPELADQFNQKYGEGAAERALGR